MKLVTRRGFILWVIFLLTISEINGSTVRRRKREDSHENSNDLDWQTILDNIRKIPLVGNSLYKGFKDINRMINRLDQLTNGAVSRIAGGYPPCTITLVNIHCDGKAKNGGIAEITKELINDTALPMIVKTMIIHLLETTVFPILDVFFGVPVHTGQNM